MATVPEIVIPGMTLDSSIPVEPLDPILALGGVLFLADLANHPSASIPAGMLTDGMAIPNIAWEGAATILGSGTETTLAGSWVNNGFTSADGAFERTPKGGVAYASKTAGQTQGHYKALALPQAIADYFNSHDADDTYASLWSRTTRPGGGTTPHSLVRLGQNGSVFKNAFQENPTNTPPSLAGQPAVTALLRGRANMNLPDTSISHLAHGYGGVTMPAVLTNVAFFGPLGSGDVNFSPSWVFYRLTLASLSVAGRTYDEFYAYDHELFTQECQASTGRITGDTFTAPTILAA